jgi:hypothetical protein
MNPTIEDYEIVIDKLPRPILFQIGMDLANRKKRLPLALEHKLCRGSKMNGVSYLSKIHVRLPEFEKLLLKDIAKGKMYYEGSEYARSVIKNRWPEFESNVNVWLLSITDIAKNVKDWYQQMYGINTYAQYVVKDRWDIVEPLLLNHYTNAGYQYVVDVIKGRNIQFENMMYKYEAPQNNKGIPYIWNNYYKNVVIKFGWDSGDGGNKDLDSVFFASML